MNFKAKRDQLPRESKENPVQRVHDTLLDLEKKCEEIVSVDIPDLVAKCLSQLEEYVEILCFYTAPQYRPFYEPGEREEEGSFRDVPEVLFEKLVSSPRAEMARSEPIYLQQIITLAKEYVIHLYIYHSDVVLQKKIASVADEYPIWGSKKPPSSLRRQMGTPDRRNCTKSHSTSLEGGKTADKRAFSSAGK